MKDNKTTYPNNSLNNKTGTHPHIFMHVVTHQHIRVNLLLCITEERNGRKELVRALLVSREARNCSKI